jgi:hypothetical protein
MFKETCIFEHIGHWLGLCRTELPIPQPLPNKNKFGGLVRIKYFCVMERTIKVSELKVTGNLDFIFNKLERVVSECELEGYTKRVGKVLSTVVDFGFTDCEDWFNEMESEDERPQIEAILILGHVFVIRLNNLAQKHINGIDMPSIAEQLNSSSEIQKYFKDVTFV